MASFDKNEFDEDEGIEDFENYVLSQSKVQFEEETEISVDSEKSHEPLFTKDEISEKITFLTFDLSWMYIVTLASVFLFVTYSYEMFFNSHFCQDAFELLIGNAVCDIITAIDIIVIIIHSYWKKISQRKGFKGYNKALVTIDIISLTSCIHDMVCYYTDSPVLRVISLCFVLFRMYRVVRYFYIISLTPGRNHVNNLMHKYGLILYLLIHTLACLWQYNELYYCVDLNTNNKPDWSQWQWYSISIYYVMCQISAIALNGHVVCDAPSINVISIAMLLIGYTFLCGIFVGAWTSTQVESYRRHANFSRRLQLIEELVKYHKISSRYRNKLNNYYLTFWSQQGGIQSSSMLLTLIPTPIRTDITLDKYWHFLQQSYLLMGCNDALLRAIAMSMQTQIYTEGEIIVEKGKERHTMTFVVRGSLQILSAEDNESSILTLGMGTLLGDVSLILSCNSRVQVVASSYCIIQKLEKSDFWRVANKYVNLNQNHLFHKRLVQKLQSAWNCEELKDVRAATGKESLKMLKLVKKQLHTEKPRTDNGYYNSMERISDLHYSDLYILSQQEKTMRTSDEICLNTYWPWILQPQSLFLDLWEYLVVAIVMLVAIMYPYQYCFLESLPAFMTSMMVAIDTIYIMDVVVQMFTAVEDGNVIVSSFVEILSIRCRQSLFIFDVIAIIPLDHLHRMVNVQNTNGRMSAFTLLRVCKFLKVTTFMRKLGLSFHVNVALIRCVGYVMYLLLTAYFLGCMYFAVACPNGPNNCKRNSWMDDIKQRDELTGGSRFEYAFGTSMYYSMMLLSRTGISDLSAKNLMEVYMIYAFFIIGTLTFSYLVADYSATLMLANRSLSLYIETSDVIRNFLTESEILRTIQQRANDYLALQWVINEGYYIIYNVSVISDAPKKLCDEVKWAKYGSYFARIPLFQGVNEECLREIVGLTEVQYLPPNEIIIYAGEIPKEFYVVENGSCSFISAATGKLEKMVGIKSYFLLFEMLLEVEKWDIICRIINLVALPGIFNISTVTNVTLVKLQYKDLLSVLKTNDPGILQDLMKVSEETTSSLAVNRLFTKRASVMFQDYSDVDESSWFVFPKRKMHPRNIDYEVGFIGARFFKFFRVVLLRRTIMPYGRFIMYWEMSRALAAFLVGMIYPPSEIFVYTQPAIIYLKIILDIFAFVDIYIRMHVAYYNKKGILVTHPRYTAANYFSRAFAIDLIGALPTQHILYLFVKPDQNHKDTISLFHRIKNILNYNRLLQLYRLPDAFAYWRRDILKSTSVTLNVVKFVPLTLVFINVIASTLLIIMCEFEEEEGGTKVKLVPQDHSWVVRYQKMFQVPELSSMQLYILSYYWMTAISLSVGFDSVAAEQPNEMCFIIIAILAGYLVFNYVLVIISSSIASININLTLYQKNIKQLIAYMDREKIDKKLQQTAIYHFEYLWQRTHGVRANDMIKRFHLALQQDLVLSLYENTFIKVPIFADCTKSFYRMIGVHMKERYFLKGTPIIRLNDIIGTIYIVHKGSVLVKGPDGSVLTVLSRGCVFGNIDNVFSTRSLTMVIAEHSVDLLCIKTNEFYELCSEFSTVLNSLKKHLILHNLSYIGGAKSEQRYSDTDTGQKNFSKIIKILRACNYNLFSMLASYASCVIVTYQVAFQKETLTILLLSYTLDILHIFNVLLGFYMPFQNKLGELVTDRALIRKRYMVFTRFYSEVFALIPFELIGFAVQPDKRMITTWLRLNRLLRLFNVVHYFNVTFNRLNIKVEIIKLGAICVYFSLMLHFCTCILFMVGCPYGVCSVDGWTHTPDKKPICDPNNYYMCSFYFTSTLTTCSGVANPRTMLELCICIVVMLFSAFLVVVIIGDLSSIVQNYSYTLVNYDYSLSELKIFLTKSMISEPLIKRVISYAYQLWAKENGKQIPQFLLEAPNFLQQDIKNAAYGKHLYENYIFVTCHNDFLRLLIGALNVHTYFAGDTICVQGVVNNRMYFIHKGSVEIVSVEKNIETLVDELYERDCFGIIQGLFVKTPHSYTYRASIVTVILSLELKDWLHLMKYFPAARFEIYERILHIL